MLFSFFRIIALGNPRCVALRCALLADWLPGEREGNERHCRVRRNVSVLVPGDLPVYMYIVSNNTYCQLSLRMHARILISALAGGSIYPKPDLELKECFLLCFSLNSKKNPCHRIFQSHSFDFLFLSFQPFIGCLDLLSFVWYIVHRFDLIVARRSFLNLLSRSFWLDTRSHQIGIRQCEFSYHHDFDYPLKHPTCPTISRPPKWSASDKLLAASSCHSSARQSKRAWISGLRRTFERRNCRLSSRTMSKYIHTRYATLGRTAGTWI